MSPLSVNVTRINLSYYKGIYIPNEDYFAADFLLDEWIELIPNSQGYLVNMNERLSSPNSLY